MKLLIETKKEELDIVSTDSGRRNERCRSICPWNLRVDMHEGENWYEAK